MHGLLAHIIDARDVVVPHSWTTWALIVGPLAFAAWLVAQHQYVKHGARWSGPPTRSLTIVVFAALLASSLPGPAGAQEPTPPVGLPDLAALPPIIWFDRLAEVDDGRIARVLSFDGYIHNAGEGVLELVGNPQVAGDVKQRFFDGNDWVEVAAPRVIYETTDDHNHFHLMAAASYELWDEARSAKVTDAAKVGFCLLDTEQVDQRLDSLYPIAASNYCEQNNPEATALRMGITPGWVDTYDASTTLQWVDVSNTRPGRYWVAALTDPEDQIVESDEDNNGHVFSQNSFAVSGLEPRPAHIDFDDEPITLRADPYGTVGAPRWRVVSPPRHGSLDVPIDVDFASGSVRYTPEPGFTGTDRFDVTVRDSSRPFPLEPSVVTIEIEVDAVRSAPVEPTPAIEADPDALGEMPDLTGLATFAAVDVQLALQSTGAAEWLARDLPAGLELDRRTGLLSGVPTTEGSGIATLVVRPEDRADFVSVDIPWSVSTTTIDMRPALDDLNAISSPRGERVRLFIGAGTVGATYEATGLPAGLEMVSNTPLIAGEPTESGEFEIEVTETIDGEVTNTSSFVWTIRLGPYPEFPL